MDALTEPEYAVWTGRFQPPHTGHFAVLGHSMRQLPNPHVAVLTADFGSGSADPYGLLAAQAYAVEKNPLTVWERTRLMHLGLEAFDLPAPVTVIVAPRHDAGWATAVGFYPPRRIICLTDKDDFERAKADRWRERGETVRVFRTLSSAEVLTTSAIKRRIRGGADWRRFMPEPAHDYFAEIDGPSRAFGV